MITVRPSAVNAIVFAASCVAILGTTRLLALRNQDANWAQGYFKLFG